MEDVTMKRIVLKVLIASLLLQTAGNAVAAQRSFLQTSFRTVKSLVGLAVAAAVSAAAYKLWNYWTTKKVISGTQKSLIPDRKPIQCSYVEEQDYSHLSGRRCVFTMYNDQTPRMLHSASNEVIANIRYLIDREDALPLCDEQGDRDVVTGSSNKEILSTLKCDENTIRYNLAQLGMQKLLGDSFAKACLEAGITKEMREKPWIRENAREVIFEQALRKHIIEQLENQSIIIKTGKHYLLGDTEQKKVNEILELCKHLDRIKTLQRIFEVQIKREQQESDAKVAQEMQQVERKRVNSAQLSSDEQEAIKVFNQLNPGQPLPKPQAQSQSAKVSVKRPTAPSAPGGMSFN